MRANSFAFRIGKAVVVIALIALGNFFLVRMAPGDPAQVMAGQSGAADEKYLAQLRQEFGLDQSLPVQLGKYAQRIVRLDLGYSHRQSQPEHGTSSRPCFRAPMVWATKGSATLCSLAMARHRPP